MTINELIYGRVIFDPDNAYHRAIRRAVMMGVIVLIAELVKGVLPIAPEYAVPLIAAVGALLDKYLRDSL